MAILEKLFEDLGEAIHLAFARGASVGVELQHHLQGKDVRNDFVWKAADMLLLEAARHWKRRDPEMKTKALGILSEVRAFKDDMFLQGRESKPTDLGKVNSFLRDTYDNMGSKSVRETISILLEEQVPSWENLEKAMNMARGIGITFPPTVEFSIKSKADSRELRISVAEEIQERLW